MCDQAVLVTYSLRWERDPIPITIYDIQMAHSTNLLKDIKYLKSKPLMLIINQCLETGIFPSKLKIAKVIPILKRGDETIFDNYRPISILPSISKVFERIIFNQIHNYFHVNILYFCSQYSFRKEHSTELAVLELIDRITQHLDKGKTPINIYFDLSKAYQTAPQIKILWDRRNSVTSIRKLSE